MEAALSVTVPSSASQLPPGASQRARALAGALGASLTFADWLDQQGHRDPEATRRFLNPRLAELSSPDGMADRGIAATRIARAIEARERIVVFGDYDCDGMTATAIFTEFLRGFDADVTPLLASRFAGGYGVSGAALARIFDVRPSLVITCDCGSSDHESLEKLSGAGIDVIVVDHHLVPDRPLPVLGFLNPHRPVCNFEYKGLASCGLALSVAAAVRAALGKPYDLRPLLDLVAIGTIADVAPLDGDNRALVRAGLRVLSEARRPGVKALLELAKIDPFTPLGAEDVSYRIAPRLNAPGRLGAPDLAVQLLLSRTLEEAQALGAELEQRSVERRAQQDRIIEEAIAEVEREGWAERPAIVVGREGWNHGIVGIVAGRLVARFGRPVVVIGFEEGVGRGSVRGPRGARLHDAVTACAPLLNRYGGHQAAAGLEVVLPRLAAFRERFEQACADLGTECGSVEDGPRVWLARGDSPARVLADFAQLEPCGETNPMPELVVEGDVISAREVTGGHLKLEIGLPGGERLAAFGIGLGPRASELRGVVTVSGRLRPDRYRGGGAVELKLERIW